MKYSLHSRFQFLAICVPLLFLSACSFKSDDERAKETQLRLEKLGGAFAVHHAYQEVRAHSIDEVINSLTANDPEPLEEDVLKKVTQTLTQDAWGAPIAFTYVDQPEGLRVKISSSGPDRKRDTSDDIIFNQPILSYQVPGE